MKLINCTRHKVIKDLITGAEYQKSKYSAGTYYNIEKVGEDEDTGAEIVKFNYSSVYDLPEPSDDIVCIVSTVTLRAITELYGNDGKTVPLCCSPNKPVMDSNGEVVGCQGFKING